MSETALITVSQLPVIQEELSDLFRRDAPGGRKQSAVVLVQSIRLDENLRVVIVILEAEQVQRRGLGDQSLELMEDRRPSIGKGIFDLANRESRHVLITALGKLLRRLLK